MLVRAINRIREFFLAIRNSRRQVREVNALMRSIDPRLVKWSWVKAVTGGLSSIGIIAFVGVLIQETVDGYQEAGKVTYSAVSLYTLGLLAYMFVIAVFDAIHDWKRELLEDELGFRLKGKKISKLRSLDLGRLTDPSFIALKERAAVRGEASVLKLWNTQMALIGAVCGVIASLGVIFALSPALIFLALVPVVPKTIRAAVIEKKRRTRFEGEHDLRRSRDEYARCVTSRFGVVQAKMFRFADYMLARFSGYADKLRASNRDMKLFEFKAELSLSVLDVVMVALAMLYLGQGLVDGSLTIVKGFFFLGAMKTMGRSLAGFSRVVVNLNSACTDYAYLEEFHATQPLIDETGCQKLEVTAAPKFEVCDVSFSYPGQNRLALDRCSLSIASGEVVAFVGKNGAGKTTLLRMLIKVYLPNLGLVLVGRQSTSSITQESLLDRVMCVTQDATSLDVPLYELIAGCSRAYVDDSRLVRAARLAGSYDFIVRLEKGFDTQVGEDWPGGVGFSSGEKQRIKLTAAFYRLLRDDVFAGFFDEPMSNCDSQTRSLFYQSLRSFAGKTIVVIAHDPLYLSHFDRVIEIDDGRVVGEYRGDEIVGYRERVLRAELAGD
ncbi:MAG TPA: ABC transporter ATP-binding protein [Candidatus Paceibacterota bacterium]